MLISQVIIKEEEEKRPQRLFCWTMRNIAVLLIVLLGVAHFATVGRCEDGKCEQFSQPGYVC